jgi:hypothetical protein
MTPELRRSIAARALALREQLNDGAAGRSAVDVVWAARAAHRIFEDAADETHVRWLNLELAGYGLASVRPLHEALRVPLHDRLVAHVAAYRTQRGVELAPRPSRDVFAHFFVEGLADLVAARDHVRQGSGRAVELDFEPHPAATPGYPTRAEFPPDVFERIVGGFLAVLFLHLGSVAG